uniref:Uncharacterized protein n=1 Tax=Cannabis sativa TaxID=3483 RepID=A0A803P7V9_CANSA
MGVWGKISHHRSVPFPELMLVQFDELPDRDVLKACDGVVVAMWLLRELGEALPHLSRWVPPAMGSYSICTNTSMVMGRGFVGFGCVIQGGDVAVWAAWAFGAVVKFEVLMVGWLGCLISICC